MIDHSLYVYCVTVLCTAGDHWMMVKYELLVFSQCYPDYVTAPDVVCLCGVVHVVFQ